MNDHATKLKQAVKEVFEDIKALSKDEFREELVWHMDPKNFDVHSPVFLKNLDIHSPAFLRVT